MRAVGTGVELKNGQFDVIADLPDLRSHDRRGVLWVAELEMHAAADVLDLQHRASPGGAGDSDLYGLGAEFGMTGEQSFAAPEQHGSIAVVHRLNVKHRGRRKISKIYATLDLRLDNAAVDFFSQIRVGAKHTGNRRQGYRVSGAGTRVV